MDKKTASLCFWPKNSTNAFQVWRYGSYEAFFQQKYSERDELMRFSPALVVSWNSVCVRYEFVVIMTKTKNAQIRDVWFWKLRNPAEVLDEEYDSGGSGPPWTSNMLWRNGENSTGTLPINAAPKLACEHLGTVIEAGRRLRYNGSRYSFALGYEYSWFRFFYCEGEHLGPPIITSPSALWHSMCAHFAPSKSQQGQNKRKTPVRLRRRILERDGYKCVDCGRSPRNDPSCVLHVDHRIAVACGGTDHPDNLQTLCDWCNLGKKTDPDWKLA